MFDTTAPRRLAAAAALAVALGAGVLNAQASAAPVTGAVRASQPHDFDANGSPDLLARDGSGTLWRHEGNLPGVKVGAGWQVYQWIEATGDIGGSAVGDVIGVDGGGYMWVHKGVGNGNFAAGRIRAESGWAFYKRLAAGSDVTGDGRPDIVAVDRYGILRVHAGTGRDTAPTSSTVASMRGPAGASTPRSRPSGTSRAPRPGTWSPATPPASSGCTPARATAPSRRAPASAAAGTCTPSSSASATRTVTGAPT